MIDESKSEPVHESHAEHPEKAVKDQMANANEALPQFTPTTDFVGYPFGKDQPIHFRGGQRSTPVPKAWLDNLSEDKGGNKPRAKSTENKPATQG